MSDRQETVEVNEGTADQDFTGKGSGSKLAAHEKLVNVRTLERIYLEKIDRDIGINNDTVEVRIQNANSTAGDSIITPKIE